MTIEPEQVPQTSPLAALAMDPQGRAGRRDGRAKFAPAGDTLTAPAGWPPSPNRARGRGRLGRHSIKLMDWQDEYVPGSTGLPERHRGIKGPRKPKAARRSRARTRTELLAIVRRAATGPRP